jgi:hypothetical protein
MRRLSSGIWRRQLKRLTVFAHDPLLMGQDAKIAARFGRAEQNKPCGFIFGEKRVCPRLIYGAAQQPSGARQASALVADRREADAIARGRIPNEFVPVALDAAFTFRRLEHNQVAITFGRAAAWLQLLPMRE